MGWSKDHGTAAKVNAEYAKEQGNVAKQEATNLAELKSNVEAATQNASTAATNANTATQNANTAKTNADNAASEAIIQANHAKNEGDRAKQEADRLAGTDVSKLDNKITEVTTQLAQTTDYVTFNAINVRMPFHNLDPAKANGSTDDLLNIQTIINYANSVGIRDIYIPYGTYLISDTPLFIPGGMRLIGSWGAKIKSSSTARTNHMVQLMGNDITLDNLEIDGCYPEQDYTSTIPLEIGGIFLSNSKDITIKNCYIHNINSAVYLDSKTDKAIDNIRINGNTFIHTSYGVLIGKWTELSTTRNDYIDNVFITNNTIKNGLFGGDGIKTAYRCRNVVITNNLIENMKRDAIDLFVSGDNVVISNNILRKNAFKGIDIKKDSPNFPISNFGENRKMIISNNLIDGHVIDYGISIAQNTALDNTFLIIISGNSLSNNDIGAIYCGGDNINIDGNLFNLNCKTNGSVIRVIGKSAQFVKNINITKNQIVNNGNQANDIRGIDLLAFVEDANITDNIVFNDSNMPNNHQKVGLYVNGECRNITVRHNKIKGHVRNVWIKNGADIHGESLYIPIGDIAKANFNRTFVGIQMKSKASIIDARLTNTTDITIPDGTDAGYIVFQIYKISNGTLSSALMSSDTTTVPMSAYVPKVLNTVNYNNDINQDLLSMKNGDLLACKLLGGGGGKPITNANIEIRYIEY